MSYPLLENGRKRIWLKHGSLTTSILMSKDTFGLFNYKFWDVLLSDLLVGLRCRTHVTPDSSCSSSSIMLILRSASDDTFEAIQGQVQIYSQRLTQKDLYA
ncbi:hypothetical protein RRG08_054565 [Elysia crispata]|uniref:Uncharacterized protein n=1 Tax=Elysia crispata TaxID=231223 RepID=A0AAE1E7S5_9GAST|nr:hypothetical protein RRG08_054565 [Elysia crispata]